MSAAEHDMTDRPADAADLTCPECGYVAAAPQGLGAHRHYQHGVTGDINYGRRIAEKQRAYYEANKDEIAEKKRAYYEANKDEIAEKQRAYREANKDEIAEKQRAYYEANKDEIAEKQRAYREANKDEIAEKQRAYREANKDEIAEKKRAYYEANKDEIAEKKRAYREANKDEIAEKQRAGAARRVAELAADPALVNRGAVDAAVEAVLSGATAKGLPMTDRAAATLELLRRGARSGTIQRLGWSGLYAGAWVAWWEQR